MSKDDNMIKYIMIHNCAIFFSITAITVGGLWLTGTWWGLVSLFLLLNLGEFSKG